MESSGLIPANDPTLLFTNAGMVQFKDVFLGRDPRPYTRATTSQKCVRAGGKHNDLENVGFTARHHTFFEMLGNFSFGDYFKKDAIHYAWELVTKEWQLPQDKLYVTVYKDDHEAADLWHKQEGVPTDRIYRFGEKDNFWSMGDTGPCGPCTEIFIDRGAQHGCGKATCAMGCDCDRYMEFWNLVFMQFDRSSDGKLTPLPKPSVDTGAGLERIASILQNGLTNYDTDLFQVIFDKTSQLAKRAYDPKTQDVFSFRVVADHSRAITFLIADGVMPSNEGRGYVLRRILRRAVRHGRKLGFTGPFLYKTCGFVIDQMRGAYPELVSKRTLIEKLVLAEEEQFFKTLDRGLGLLEEAMGKIGSQKMLNGQVAFTLYDTFGFPLDLTRTIAAEQGVQVDEQGFDQAMQAQRDESRKHWKGSGDANLSAEWLKLADDLRKKNQLPQFVGYEALNSEGKILAVFPLESGEFQVVTDRTPFYGESGGQVGDKGTVESVSGSFRGEVVEVTRPVADLIVAKVRADQSVPQVGDVIRQNVQQDLRKSAARNHTATHLLHWALREVLGDHVKQAGSLVTTELLRFDFTHFKALTPSELSQVENLINQKIWSGDGVKKEVLSKDEALKKGAIAFFGEKYGDQVRVISVGDYSVELCGGTHVDQSSDLGVFKIVSEAGIAAGTRRIIAYTAGHAFEYLRDQENRLKHLRDQVKASHIDEIPLKIERLAESERELKRKLDQWSAKQRAVWVDTVIGSAKNIEGGIRIVQELEAGPDAMKSLRETAEAIKAKRPDAVIILAQVEPESGKGFLVAAKGAKIPADLFDASKFVKENAPRFGGKGGGKPDFAQAGGEDVSGLRQLLRSLLS